MPFTGNVHHFRFLPTCPITYTYSPAACLVDGKRSLLSLLPFPVSSMAFCSTCNAFIAIINATPADQPGLLFSQSRFFSDYWSCFLYVFSSISSPILHVRTRLWPCFSANSTITGYCTIILIVTHYNKQNWVKMFWPLNDS